MTATVGFAANSRRREQLACSTPKSPALRDVLFQGAGSSRGPGYSGDSTQYVNPPTPLPQLEVRESPGRGYGLFAVDTIPAYSRIMEDFALLSLAEGEDLPQLWPKYKLLSPDERLAFDQLNPPANQVRKESDLIARLLRRGYNEIDAENMARVSSIFLGNSFKSGNGQRRWPHVLFPLTARINHSCTPNAHCHYRETTGAQYSYALRDIQPGEEVEIAYFDLTLPHEARQTRTAAWSFTCQCPACSSRLPSDYPRRLAAVHEWQQGDGQIQQYPEPVHGLPQTIRHAISIAESDKSPWLKVSLPNLYRSYAAALMNNHRSISEAADAIEQSILWQARIAGSDYPALAQARVQLSDMHTVPDAG